MNERLVSGVIKRSVVVGNHKTSVSLEDCFWRELRLIALSRTMMLCSLIEEIDTKRTHKNLSSAIRVHVLDHCRKTAA